ncbi:Protein kinase domain [Pelomyxa schiedti]|nr:Protein kinase domain [Pelomyxa schiedti]
MGPLVLLALISIITLDSAKTTSVSDTIPDTTTSSTSSEPPSSSIASKDTASDNDASSYDDEQSDMMWKKVEAEALCDLYRSLMPVAAWTVDICVEFPDEPPCDIVDSDFGGITCNDLGHVWLIDLSTQATQVGTIPASLGNLSQLHSLSLPHNKINGTIPASLAVLPNLSLLDLGDNDISGEFPYFNCTQMSSLTVSENFLSGTVPACFTIMPNLFSIALYDNHLEGTLPPLPSALHSITVGHNNFTGSVDAFMNQPYLLTVSLDNNSFYGTLPSSLSLLTSLQTLSASHNFLTGTLPTELFTQKIAYMYLNHNYFSGSLPDVAPSTKTTLINLSNNLLSGSIPQSFINATRLKQLYLAFNSFVGEVPVPNSPRLHTIDLSSNMFSGTIPSYTLVRCPQLSNINMSNNLLSGTIDSLNSSYIFQLDLRNNYLTGTLPFYISEQKVLFCFLDENCFDCQTSTTCNCNNTRPTTQCHPSSSSLSQPSFIGISSQELPLSQSTSIGSSIHHYSITAAFLVCIQGILLFV